MTDPPRDKPLLLELSFDQLQQAVVQLGQPAYRAEQLADWVYRKGLTDPARMSNLPRPLVEEFAILTSRLAARREAADRTVKLLLELADGQHVETVAIPQPRWQTACLSTQVGCAMACPFCASGLEGLGRDLRAGEILEQLLHLQQATGRRPTHAVFMGMGEPLANYDATRGALQAMIDPARFGLSARRITVSTVGLPGPIRRLAAERLPITLALSLHAPTDALRRDLLPAGRRFPLEQVLSAAEEFQRSRNRLVTLEYVLLGGANDTAVCAEALGRIARRLRCNVNLIRYNPVRGLPYRDGGAEGAQDFARRLRGRGVRVQVRRSRGRQADAACGQLRRASAPHEQAATD